MLIFILFVFAAMISLIQLFGFCAPRVDALSDSLAGPIVFFLGYMFLCVELAKAAERYIDDSWSMAEKYGVSDPRVLTTARVLMTIGALLCAGLAASGLLLPYFNALPKLLLFFVGLAVSLLLILRPAQTRVQERALSTRKNKSTFVHLRKCSYFYANCIIPETTL